MAIGRLSVGVGPKGKAGPHAQYIAREGKYANHNDKVEKLEATGSGNMPSWAKTDPNFFWQMSDDKERKNGTSYREHVIALPRELTTDQRHELIKDWIAQEIGDKHAYQYAIHNPLAADGGEQPHAHIMFSERLRDGIERDPDTYFKRYNAKNPEAGGSKKANTPKMSAERKADLKQQRDRWEKLCNSHLEMSGSAARISMKTLAEQGVDREPINLSMQQIKRADIKEIYSNELRAINEKYYEYADRAINYAGYRANFFTGAIFAAKKTIAKNEFRLNKPLRSLRTADSSGQQLTERIASTRRSSERADQAITGSKRAIADAQQLTERTDQTIDARLEQQQQRIAQSQQQQRIESRSAFRMLKLQLSVKVVQPDKYSSNRERGTVLKNAITPISKSLYNLVEDSEYKGYKVIISNKDDRGTLINPELSRNNTAQAIESFMLRPEALSDPQILSDFGGKINIREFTEKYDLKCDFNDLKELDQLNPVRVAEPMEQRIETPKPNQDQQNNIDLNY